MGTPSPQPTPEPFPIRWALILMIAMVFAVIIGMLTYLETNNWPAALLAALAAAGTAVPVLHHLLGT